MAFDFIAEQLAQQQAHSRYRQPVCVDAIDGQNIKVDGKSYINFSSNDYLGLNQHSAINQAFQQGLDEGLCSTGSNLITGYHKAHQRLEDEICTWLNKPACMLFTSGFAANSGFLSALAQKNVHYLLDKLSHASLIDGAYQSKAKPKRFKHNDMEHLTQLLSRNESDNNIVISEGVFSMDGDKAPIADLHRITQQHNAWLYVDDAHSIGVVGNKGQGSCAENDIDIVMATFGKAIATSGAFIACSAELKAYLSNFCRHYIYTTAMSPALALATLASIKLIQIEDWRRDLIKKLSEYFVSLLDCDVELLPTESSIHALVIGDETKTLEVAAKLKKSGFWVTAIRPPTVPNNTSRLRVTICANHTMLNIKALAENINKVIN